MKLFGETRKNMLYFGNSMKTPIIVTAIKFKNQTPPEVFFK